MEGTQATPGGPVGGGLAHLASQPLDLVQPQEPFGPRILPQLLPEGLQSCGDTEAISGLQLPAQGQSPLASQGFQALRRTEGKNK
jgi:hypothetical protein